MDKAQKKNFLTTNTTHPSPTPLYMLCTSPTLANRARLPWLEIIYMTPILNNYTVWLASKMT